MPGYLGRLAVSHPWYLYDNGFVCLLYLAQDLGEEFPQSHLQSSLPQSYLVLGEYLVLLPVLLVACAVLELNLVLCSFI